MQDYNKCDNRTCAKRASPLGLDQHELPKMLDALTYSCSLRLFVHSHWSFYFQCTPNNHWDLGQAFPAGGLLSDASSLCVCHPLRQALRWGLFFILIDELPEWNADTYHHIGNRTQYFAKLKSSLRPAGRLVIVDFKADSPNGPPVRHRISPERVTQELKAAGYALVDTLQFLPRQYCLIFDKGNS